MARAAIAGGGAGRLYDVRVTRHALLALVAIALFSVGFAVPGCGAAEREPASERDDGARTAGETADRGWGATQYGFHTGSFTFTLDEPVTWGPWPGMDAAAD